MTDTCHCDRKKVRADSEKRALMNRLNRIEGQVRGIRRMVEDDAYCTELLTQSSAVSAAMNGFMREVLGEHIRTCVADGIRAGDDEQVNELLAMLQKLMR